MCKNAMKCWLRDLRGFFITLSTPQLWRMSNLFWVTCVCMRPSWQCICRSPCSRSTLFKECTVHVVGVETFKVGWYAWPFEKLYILTSSFDDTGIHVIWQAFSVLFQYPLLILCQLLYVLVLLCTEELGFYCWGLWGHHSVKATDYDYTITFK